MSSCSAEAQPHPSLSGLVQNYTGSALAGFAPGVHVGVPSPGLSLILTLRDHPVTLAPSRQGTPGSTTFSGVVAGLQLSPVLITHGASSHTLTVQLTPAGARCLLGVPAVALVGQTVSADAVLGASFEGLRHRVEMVDAWPTRFQAGRCVSAAPPT